MKHIVQIFDNSSSIHVFHRCNAIQYNMIQLENIGSRIDMQTHAGNGRR